MLYEIKNNDKNIECETHGKLKRVISLDGHDDCPYCVLQFLLSNDIEVGDSVFRNVSWDVDEIKINIKEVN